MASPSLDRIKAKNHRAVFRAAAFLLFCSGLSLILYTLPPVISTVTQAAVVYKLQTAVAAPAAKF